MSKYETQSLYEASYLLAKGFKLSGENQNGSKKTIIIEGDGVEEEALCFYNGALISAKKLTDSYRTLKDFVFQK